MEAKEKDDNAPIPIRRSREETGAHVFAAAVQLDPQKLVELVTALDDLLEADEEGHLKKEKKAKTEGGEPPRKAPWVAALGLLGTILLSQVGQWWTDIHDLGLNVEKVLVQQEQQIEAVEAVEKKVDLISEDYEVMERALVDYIDRVGGPGVPLPDSVIILRDKHSRTR